MNVVAINGSARENGNTAILIKEVFKELNAEGIKTELVQLAGKQVQGCIACMKCFGNKNGRCAVEYDFANECISKLEKADGIILGSPVYYAGITAGMKGLIERTGFVSRANGDFLRRKVGAAVVAVRRAGAIQAFNALNDFFFITEMIVPGSSYWNIGVGRGPGEVASDEEGMKTMRVLGQNMAWLLKKIK